MSSNAYKNAGVDVEAGYESTRLINEQLKNNSNNPNILSSLGGFASLFDISKLGMKEPVLVSGTDGVGTKLKLAFMLNKHNTIGQDLVAMCVNDLICVGAKPLYFLDYLALGKNVPSKVSEIVSGITSSLDKIDCALVGGETAEMAGFYKVDEYDLAGFVVGAVEKSQIPNPSKISEGDKIVAIASSGVHSNGFSLVRKVFNLDDPKFEVQANESLLNELLTPTKIYVNLILDLFKEFEILGVSNITGGGFYENIPRCLPENVKAEIEQNKVEVLPIFDEIQKIGNINDKDMFSSFNMGVGMIVVIKPQIEKEVLDFINSFGETAYTIGTIKNSNKKVCEIV